MRSVKEMMNLTGKVALVTGGTGWLGSAISESLDELGANVHVTYRTLTHDYLKLDRASRHTFDFDKPVEQLQASIQTLLESIEEREARPVDVLVNNMCCWPRNVDFLSTSIDEVKNVIDVNLTAQLALTQAVARRMSSGGSIINIASMYGKVSPDIKMYRGVGGNALAYGAAKAALLQSTRYLANLLGPRGIRVNSISPGPFPREGKLKDDWFREELNSRTMLGRLADREELKGAVVLFASDLGSYITGADIAVDGGWTAM